MTKLLDRFSFLLTTAPLHARARALTFTVAIALLPACQGSSAAPPAEVAKSLAGKVDRLDRGARVHGRRLIAPDAVGRFYEKRGAQRAWPARSTMEEIVASIRDVRRDGLTPADYHLDTILALMEPPEEADANREADLDLLLTDAVAGLIDHVRYGRVRPIHLDRRWNVNPRDEAPPLEQTLAEVASARSVREALAAQRPTHFIYRGLVGALENLREIATNGGWPTIPAGKAIRPGTSDRRIPRVRARLAVSGEFTGRAPTDSLRYDPDLQKSVELFQARHRLEADGVLDKATIEAMNVPVNRRIGQVRANLERARWVLPGLTDDFILVNLPAFKAYLIRGGQNVWETRTQIGEEARQTPTFRARLSTVVFNPDWTVPPTILAEDVIEGMRQGRNVIAEKNLTILDGEREVSPSSIDWSSATPETFRYTLRQPPGPDNALGRVKFLFPNPHSIYLHDTPSRQLFEAERRTFSSGCIRVERPLELAERLLPGWDRARIERAITGGETRSVAIEEKLPILIVYWTVSVGRSGEIRYMNDVYGQDDPLLAALEAAPRRT